MTHKCYNFQILNIPAINLLSEAVLNEFCKSINYDIRKKEEYIASFKNIIGNLFIQSYIPHWIHKKKNNNLYYFYIPQDKWYYNKNTKIANTTYKNIQELNIGYSKMIACIKTLEKLHILKFIRKGVENKYFTKYLLNPIEDWDWKIFENNMNLHLSTIALFYDYNILGHIYNKIVKPNRYPASAVIKIKANQNNEDDIYIPADNQIQESTNVINGMFVNELASYKYTKIFSEYEYYGGRLFGLFNLIPKELRNRTMSFHNYVEIDYTSMILNIFSLYVTGDYFSTRPYDLVIDGILDLKKKNNDNYTPYKEVLSKILKQPTVTAYNNMLTYKSDNSAINIELFEHGLRNNKDEYEKAKSEVKHFIYDSNLYFVNLNQALYNKRKQRWIDNVDTDLPCPTFQLTQKQFVIVISSTLKTIKNFLGIMNWSWTQFLEADCLEDIVEELHKDNVLPLYIHDAFYVPNELATKYTIKSVEILKVIVDDFKSVYQTEENISKVHNEFLKYINAINQTTSTFESKRELSKYVTIFYKENKDKIMKYMKSKDRIFVFADYDVYKIKELIKKAIA